MANRHNRFKKGGGVGSADYSGGNKDVVKEAKSKKAAGGEVAKKAKGGAVEAKACGGKAMGRLDKRARGGGTGGAPWSSAHIKTSGDAGK